MATSTKSIKKPLLLSTLALAISAGNTSLCYGANELIKVDTGNGVTLDVSDPSAAIVIQPGATATNDWTKFNVGEGDMVTFERQGGGSFTSVNRISAGAGASSIMGTISAPNGNIFLSNPNGFVFGASGSINTAAFVASTSTISLDNNILTLDGTNAVAGASIVNNGTIQAIGGTENQYVALFAPIVDNQGTINADGGSVVLSNGISGTISLSGLDAGFDVSNLTLSTDAAKGINVSGDIKASNILLSSSDISLIFDESVNLQDIDMLDADDLTLDYQDQLVSINGSGADSVNSVINNEVLTGLLKNQNVKIQTSASVNINDTLNYTGGDSSTLSIESGNSITQAESAVINGAGLSVDLLAENAITLNAAIGARSGDNNVLQSFRATTTQTGNISIAGDIKTTTDININAAKDVVISGSQQINLLTEDADGEVSLIAENGSLISTDTDARLLLKAGTVSTSFKNWEGADADKFDFSQSLSDFSVNATRYNSNGLIKASNITIGTDTDDTTIHMNLTGDSQFITHSILLGQPLFSSDYDALEQGNSPAAYDLSIESTANLSVDNRRDSVIIRGADMATFGDNNQIARLGDLTISATNSEFSLSGNIAAQNITLSRDKTDDADIGSDPDIKINGTTTLNATETVDISNTPINNNQDLSIVAKNIHVNKLGIISKLGAVELIASNTVTLGDSISASSILVQGNKIELDENNESFAFNAEIDGDIIFKGDIGEAVDTSDPNVVVEPGTQSLTFILDTGDLELDAIHNIKSLNVSKEASDDSHVTLSGSITASEEVNLSNIGTTLLGDGSIEITGSTVNLSGSDLIQSEGASTTLGITATSTDISQITDPFSIKVENITADNIKLSGQVVQLNGNLITKNQLSLAGIESIILNNDVILEGAIDIFTPGTELVRPTFVGQRNDLRINTGATNIELYDLTPDSPLGSLTISGSGILTFLNSPSSADNGALTLLDGIQFDIGNGFTYDTSNNSGNIDFSGAVITGNGALTLNAGDGDISLGSLGETNASTITGLNLQGGNLNLHGNVVLTGTEAVYDFTGISGGVFLHTDVTFGTEEAPIDVNFGDTTLDGTFTLTMYSDNIDLGTVGANKALQNLNIYSEKADLILTDNVNIVGEANINTKSLTLNSIFTTTGDDATISVTTTENIEMNQIENSNEFGQFLAPAGHISLTSNTGDIRLGTLDSLKTVTVTALAGGIYNNINDFDSNKTANIKSETQTINGNARIGDSVDQPIVIDAISPGEIRLSSTGSIYIANMRNVRVISDRDFIDSNLGGDTALQDAISQLLENITNSDSNHPEVTSTFGLISNPVWQEDEQQSIRKLHTPVSTPAFYRGKYGWRLGSYDE